MDSFEINKIIAAILVTFLIIFGIGRLSDIVFKVDKLEVASYKVEAIDQDNSRLCTFAYTVANTNWNKYTVVFPADTTGTFNNDNGMLISKLCYLTRGCFYPL